MGNRGRPGRDPDLSRRGPGPDHLAPSPVPGRDPVLGVAADCDRDPGFPGGVGRPIAAGARPRELGKRGLAEPARFPVGRKEWGHPAGRESGIGSRTGGRRLRRWLARPERRVRPSNRGRRTESWQVSGCGTARTVCGGVGVSSRNPAASGTAQTSRRPGKFGLGVIRSQALLVSKERETEGRFEVFRSAARA